MDKIRKNKKNEKELLLFAKKVVFSHVEKAGFQQSFSQEPTTPQNKGIRFEW